MYTIINNNINEEIIKNSRFISLIYKVYSSEDVDKLLNNIKELYKDATHYCYAYVIDNQKKCSDDKEPSGTAGIPIMNILEKNDLNYVLCIVVRYFGGIKLGSNGLIRAYSKCTSNCIEKDNIVRLCLGYNINIVFDYTKLKETDYILKDSIIINKTFDEKIIYNLDADENLFNKLNSLNYKITDIKKKYIEEKKTSL